MHLILAILAFSSSHVAFDHCAPIDVGKRVAAEKHQVRVALVDPGRDLSPVVRISEFNTSEAILIPLKVGERMVQRCRADPLGC
jgi:hypothetical protein